MDCSDRAELKLKICKYKKYTWELITRIKIKCIIFIIFASLQPDKLFTPSGWKEYYQPKVITIFYSFKNLKVYQNFFISIGSLVPGWT